MAKVKKTPSEGFVSGLLGFLCGTHLHQKPRESTLSLLMLLHESERTHRALKESIKTTIVPKK
jgi:hypothetical protein